MAVDRKIFTMRLPSYDYGKLKTLSKKNKRSMAAELEYILEQYFEHYELQNGRISEQENYKEKSTVNNHQLGIGNNNLFVNSNNGKSAEISKNGFN